MTLPHPLTPPESDLRDFQFMPLDVVRLAQSDLVAFEEPAAVVAAILLWGASWHGKPAGSLSNDDRSLARAAGFGRGISEWLAVKDGALRGFVECSDGRLYHPVVAEKVRDAWLAKVRQRHRTFLAAVRKHNERNPHDQREGLSLEAWEALGRPKEVAVTPVKAAAQPRLALDDRSEEEPNRVDEADMSRVTDDPVTRDKGGMSRDQDPHVTRFSGSKGEGQGEGQGQGDSYIDGGAPPVDPKRDREDLLDLAQRIARLGGVALNPAFPDRFARELDVVKGWRTDGIEPDTIADAVEVALTKASDTISSLRYYDGHVRKAHGFKVAKAGGRKPAGKPAPPLPPIDAKDDDDPRVVSARALLAKLGGYGSWLAPGKAALSVVDDEVLTITVRSRFNATWIEGNLLADIERIASTVLGRPLVKLVPLA